MKTIFNSANNQELVNRLLSLTKNSERKWGKMNVAQMLVHCQKPLEVSDGKLEVKRNLFSKLFGGFFKKKYLIKGDDFSNNLPTAKEFLVQSDFNFEKEQSKLVQMVQNLGAKGESAIKLQVHPFFGKMLPSEWGILFYKHLNHHLKQFGG